MRKYFAYIYGQVQGPLTPEQIKALPGFNRGTMVYPEDLKDGTTDDWLPAFQVREFGAIPFSKLDIPQFKPTPQMSSSSSPPAAQERPPDSKKITPLQATESDIEKIKLMEHIQALEKELRNVKNQSLEIENLKSQIREKDQKIYDLSQELLKVKEESSSKSPAVSGQKTKPPDDAHFELNIPFQKILLAGAGVVVLGTALWSLVPGTGGNRFLLSLLPSFAKKNSEPASMAPPAAVPVLQKTVPTQSVPAKAPVPSSKDISSTELHRPNNIFLRNGAVKKIPKNTVITDSATLLKKSAMDSEILMQNKRRRASAAKVREFENRGVSSSDPDWLAYIEAQKDRDQEEKTFRDLGEKYIATYGKPAWEELSKRAAKQTD